MTTEKDLKIEILRDALSELLKLKAYKDSFGKDEAYQKRQPKVWEKAHQAMDLTATGENLLQTPWSRLADVVAVNDWNKHLDQILEREFESINRLMVEQLGALKDDKPFDIFTDSSRLLPFSSNAEYMVKELQRLGGENMVLKQENDRLKKEAADVVKIPSSYPYIKKLEAKIDILNSQNIELQKENAELETMVKSNFHIHSNKLLRDRIKELKESLGKELEELRKVKDRDLKLCRSVQEWLNSINNVKGI